jgi:WD40-like Beta Propeller Repeat
MRRKDQIGVRLSVLVVVLALGAFVPSLARADVFGPIALASASTVPGFGANQQAVYAHDSAISGNGRYVVFDGSYAGHPGVWLRDLQTGAVEAVAAEDPNDPAISAPDASRPSISEDGRFVSFTTTAALDPVDDANNAPDVYVRDMDVAAGQPCEPGPGSPQPCAFTLVSAVDGANTGLTYEQIAEGGEKNFGSVAAGRSAISANGREVAFVTSAISNLAGSGTPALQVVVRYLDSDHTELVSVADEPATGSPLPGQPVSGFQGETYGAVFTGGGGAAPRFSAPEAYPTPLAIGASISGDGTTVAWMGVNVAKQARVLPAEALTPGYAEPLWRRIGDGPSAPIRRITGGSDPANPLCAASGEQVLPEAPSAADPCQGPFYGAQMGRSFGIITSGEFVDPVPQLSRDGYAVAFLADAPLVALGNGFGTNELHTDLYLANMHEGLTRTQALRPLSELASGDQNDVAEDSPIEDIGISPDGSHVAFTTKRTIFPLGSPAFVSAPAGEPGMLELFSIDLADDTLTRVSDGFDGGPSEHPHTEGVANEDPYTLIGDGALSPSFSDDGDTLAFSSTASNLVFGDGNTPPLKISSVDGSDAFLVTRVLFDPLPTPQSISAAPAAPALDGSWRLGVTARSRADGTVLLYVSLPGAGTVKASARSTVRVRVKRRGRVSTNLATRSVATTKKASRASGGALVTLTLKLAPRYRSLAGKRPGLPGAVSVTFTAARRPTLHASVRVSFLHTAKRPKKTAKKATAKGHSQRQPTSRRGSR